MMQWIGIISGFILLPVGASILINGCVSLAERFSISKLFISSIIIGLGTSFPELLVSIQAIVAGSPEIVIGNIAGSNIANIFLVVGSAVLIYPIVTKNIKAEKDVLFMIIATFLFVSLAFFGEISRLFGVIMLLILIFYLIYSVILDKKKSKLSEVWQIKEIEKIEQSGSFIKINNPIFNSFFILIGLAFLLFGADLLVNNAIKIANDFGIYESVIGLSLVAIGTSLPELATVIMASLKKQSEIVLGNVIGSCIMNILFILGISSLIKPIVISPVFLKVDIWMVVFSVIALSIPILLKKQINIFYGIFFLLIYGFYNAYLFAVFSI